MARHKWTQLRHESFIKKHQVKMLRPFIVFTSDYLWSSAYFLLKVLLKSESFPPLHFCDFARLFSHDDTAIFLRINLLHISFTVVLLHFFDLVVNSFLIWSFLITNSSMCFWVLFLRNKFLLFSLCKLLFL